MRPRTLLLLFIALTAALTASPRDGMLATSQTQCCSELWVNSFDVARPGHSTDRITASAMDSNGNVYVTGWSTGVESRSSDIVTIKYDRHGIEQWIHHFYPRGLSYSDSEGWAISVDPSGNVYVAGHATGTYAVDGCLIKYPSTYQQGQDPEWVRTYNGPGNGNDRYWDAAVDSDGNVYVTGYSAGAGTGSDYVTLKYDPTGVVQWVSRHDGTGSQNDNSYAVAVDSAKNVYVTGGSRNTSGNTDIVTIKYDPYGHEQWVNRYDGPAGDMDRGQSLVVDSSGGVYVTGWSTGVGTNLDYATIAYNPTDGTRKWVARYDGPASGNDQPAPPTNASETDSFGSYISNNQGIVASLEADGQTYLYVTGQSTGVDGSGATATLDIATVKYRAEDGYPMWDVPGQPGTTSGKPGNPANIAVRYNGPGNGIDRAWALALDRDGNVYVAGPSTGIGTGVDYAVVKYGPNGAALWDFGARSTGGMTREIAFRFNGPGNGADQAAGFATWRDTASGSDYVWRDSTSGVDHVCVTGGSVGGGTAAQDYYALMIQGADGARIWDASQGRYDWYGNVSSSDTGNDIEVSATTGQVYVTGASGPWGNTDALTVAYGPTGTFLWERRYNGSGNGADVGNAIALDAAGSVYVTGSCSITHGGTRDTDYCTSKYDGLTGAPQWGSGSGAARLYNGPGVNAADTASDIAVDADGSVYVTGESNRGAGTPGDYATIAYAPDGTVLWEARYEGANADTATAIAVNGPYVYVTGSSYDPHGGLDYVTIAYEKAAGTLVWVQRYDGTGNSTDRPEDIAVDPSGNVYVTGSSFGPEGNSDYATIKYDGVSGAEMWVRRYSAPRNGSDNAYAVAIDTRGNVFVGGGSVGSQTDYDVATIKYDGDGVLKWVSRYNGPGNGRDEASDLAVDVDGNVCVAGYSKGSAGNYDYLTIKYGGETGSELMLATYDGTAAADDSGKAIALGGGNVFVTGVSSALSQADNVVTIGYAADTEPPVVTASVEPAQLWPPNGKPVEVALTGKITDASPITGATYEVVDEYGQVQPTGTLTVVADGTYTGAVSLIASRLGTDLDGRRYTIVVSATDGCGNKGIASTVVVVPHDQRK
jgi:uncharacterized delta-60 repeat protein